MNSTTTHESSIAMLFSLIAALTFSSVRSALLSGHLPHLALALALTVALAGITLANIVGNRRSMAEKCGFEVQPWEAVAIAFVFSGLAIFLGHGFIDAHSTTNQIWMGVGASLVFGARVLDYFFDVAPTKSSINCSGPTLNSIRAL